MRITFSGFHFQQISLIHVLKHNKNISSWLPYQLKTGLVLSCFNMINPLAPSPYSLSLTAPILRLRIFLSEFISLPRRSFLQSSHHRGCFSWCISHYEVLGWPQLFVPRITIVNSLERGCSPDITCQSNVLCLVGQAY
jgi:hypothetical protein